MPIKFYGTPIFEKFSQIDSIMSSILAHDAAQIIKHPADSFLMLSGWCFLTLRTLHTSENLLLYTYTDLIAENSLFV